MGLQWPFGLNVTVVATYRFTAGFIASYSHGDKTLLPFTANEEANISFLKDLFWIVLEKALKRPRLCLTESVIKNRICAYKKWTRMGLCTDFQYILDELKYTYVMPFTPFLKHI